MTDSTNLQSSAAGEDQPRQESLRPRFLDWVRGELVWYAGSFSFHLLGLSLLLLLPASGGEPDQGDAPVMVASQANDKSGENTEKLERVFIDQLEDIDDPDGNIVPVPPLAASGDFEKNHESSSGFVPDGGGTKDGIKDTVLSEASGFGRGPKLPGSGGIGPGLGTGTQPGSGGDRIGPGGFGDIGRDKFMPGVRLRRNQRAVTAALVWLANHQLYDGRWSLQHFTDRCTDRTCTGRGDVLADSGATAMGLLPFLAAGHTHKSRGPYKEHIRKGIEWLIRQQQPDGNLAMGVQQMMYSHGLATIALCEAYGLTGDKDIGRAAQGAVNFILAAQNAADGGWRYNPKDPGDTSVVGWQLLALKSASMAGLDVVGSAFADTSKWLDSVAAHDGAEYSYQPGQAPSNTMTSVGLLCRQYLGAKRDSTTLSGGMAYLMNHMPDEAFPNIYYWYYATQVMHNMYGYEWDRWNRKMRDVLVRTQVRDVGQCANGSWAPEKDTWGKSGGRLMTTSLSCLTLEVYYRYLPLFKAGTGEEAQ